ncbi:uncharacterized protein LOC105155418 [Sesamum indicum]|uniref:Uncharacterized protein LOC105155418 n=1 Tax=Sesamum indicum TaxID=4182 RepID=A0A6I9SIK0_SESIN|nr:uncharacterized protein LOC105155418 [Sesamum indicum]
MAALHSRSNSFPSQSHPVMDIVEDQLCRLKSSEAASTSATSICANLASLRDFHEGINNLIQMPSVQTSLSNEQDENWINELLEGSLRLVDLCGFSREVVSSTKESVQDFESSIRRHKGETAKAMDMSVYVASRKKINKMVNMWIKNLKGFNQNSTALSDKDYDLKAIGTMLKETEALAFLILKSVLILMAEEKERSKQRSWSLLSKFTPGSRVHSEVQQEAGLENFCSFNIFKSLKSMDNMALQNTLKASEMTIEKLEEGVEALFRSLVKTRASLLNVLSH